MGNAAVPTPDSPLSAGKPFGLPPSVLHRLHVPSCYAFFTTPQCTYVQIDNMFYSRGSTQDTRKRSQRVIDM